MPRIALGVEYDGQSFFGWQKQPGNPSIQLCLEQAIAAIAGHPVSVVAAGRTDRGVHATGQVVHFDTTANRPAAAWVRGVNSHMHPAVAVLWARTVDTGFHARFSAINRCYRYLLLSRPQRPALHRERAGWYHGNLDLERMQQAATYLVGQHDFSAFRAAGCQAHSPVKVLEHLIIDRHGDCLVFDLKANAFLYHMVRNIVGSLVYVGSGRQPPEWMAALLHHGSRALAAPTFSPNGLYLTGVGYPIAYALPSVGSLPVL